MKPKKIWANLAVSDLDRTTTFYSNLGFKFNGRSNELTSIKIGEDEFVIHFFLKDVISTNTSVDITDSPSPNEVMFTLSAESKDQVDEWAKEVKVAGGKLISQPEEFGEGYYGFAFADPDGHAFNVFFM